MAIFAILQTEKVVQVGDRTRLNAGASFVNGIEAITKVEIKPSAADAYISVALDVLYLDWVYSAPGDVVASVRVTTGTGDDEAFGFGDAELQIITPEEDLLFSDDSDIYAEEPTANSILPEGRTSFLHVHREAQKQIMAAISKRDTSGVWAEPSSIVDKREVRDWSKYLSLQIIYQGSINEPGDVYAVKAETYRQRAQAEEARGLIALDLDGDGTPDAEAAQGARISSASLVRR